jgi:NADPH:quinone reductase-like Zn-dependent oxidoreductase
MRAMQFAEFGPPEVLQLTEVPKPAPTPGMVVLRVRASGINPADYKWRSGWVNASVPDMPVRLPQIPGYDVAGTVEAVGEGVTGIAIGDRIVAMLDHVGKSGYAEFAAVLADHAVPIPDAMDFVTAAALPCAGLTGVQLIEDFIKPTAGQTILVTGAVGSCGRFAVYAAIGLGARVVAAVRASAAAEAKALGASEVIVLGEEDWTAAPFDHVADTVGGKEVAKLCRHVRPGGSIGTVATTPIDPQGLPSAPSFFAVHNDPARLSALARDVAAGKLLVPIAKILPLEAAAQAHRLLEAGGVGGKLILQP